MTEEQQQQQQLGPLEFGVLAKEKNEAVGSDLMQLAKAANALDKGNKELSEKLEAANETIRVQAQKIKELSGDAPTEEDKQNVEN